MWFTYNGDESCKTSYVSGYPDKYAYSYDLVTASDTDVLASTSEASMDPDTGKLVIKANTAKGEFETEVKIRMKSFDSVISPQ
jgi:hypothetical protein